MDPADVSALELLERDGDVLLRVRVAPRASRQALLGAHDGALKVALTAPPVEGAANAALLKLLAKTLGRPRAQLAITAGAQSRNKTVRIAGAAADRVRAELGA